MLVAEDRFRDSVDGEIRQATATVGFVTGLSADSEREVDETVVQLGADGAFSRCELLDRVAAETLSAGQVYALAAPEMPGGDLAAAFRY